MKVLQHCGARILHWLVITALVTGNAISIQSQDLSSQPPAITSLAKDLPPCSELRRDIDRGKHGNGTDQPYMAAMRRAGVQRAFLEVNSVWSQGKAANPQTVRRLLFSAYDGPNTTIIDPAKLVEVERQGLQRILDDVAAQRVMNAHLFQGFEGRGLKALEGKPMYSYVEFLADPWLPEQQTLVSPRGKPDPILHAAYIGDVAALETELSQKTVKSGVLNRALLDAVLNRYDNTQVIDLFVKKGADINFHGHDGVTPLINAVPHPCNVRALLQLGARVNDTDKWGRTALKLAEEEKQEVSVRLLLSNSSQR